MLRILLIAAAVLIVVVAGVGAYVVSRLSVHEPAEIFSFHPEPLEARASRPLYVWQDGVLSFSPVGRLSGGTAVWRGAAPPDRVWVSPDAAHLLVLSQGELHLLGSDGQRVSTLSPAVHVFDSREDSSSYWDYSGIQWSRDGSSFYLLRRTGDHAYEPVSVRRYTLVTGRTDEVVAVAGPGYLPSEGWFLSQDGRSLYFTVYSNGREGSIHRHDLATGKTTVIGAAGGRHPVAPQDLFYDFSREALAGRHDQDVGWSWVRNAGGTSALLVPRLLDETECGLFLDALDGSGATREILRSRKAYSGMTGHRCGLAVDRSYYLPGDRYAVVAVESSTYTGKLLVDTTAGRYATLPQGFEAFFSLTSNDVTGVEVTASGLYLPPGLDFAAFVPRIRKAQVREREEGRAAQK